MTDAKRWLVYPDGSEPLDFYATQGDAETAAAALALEDRGTTFLIDRAELETESVFNTAETTTITAEQGFKIIISGDEWPHADGGFTLDSASHTLFALNCAEWLTGKSSGGDFGQSGLVSGTDFRTALTDAGHTVDTDDTFSADYATQLALLQTHEAWFVHCRDAGELGNTTAMIDWINLGGEIMFYTGNFSAHTALNVVVNDFNLDVVVPRVANNIGVLTDYSGHSHPILSGVGDIYFLGSDEIEELAPSGQTAIYTGVHGVDGSVDLLATYDGLLTA